MDYPKEQLQKLYENLPSDLQQAVFSEKNGKIIYEACTRNGIQDNNKINQFSKYTAYVLLGLLSPDNFPQKLEKELKIKKETIRQITLEINRFIFLPVKDSLEALYDIKIKSFPVKKKMSELKSPKRKDKYREPIN